MFKPWLDCWCMQRKSGRCKKVREEEESEEDDWEEEDWGDEEM